MVQKKMKEMGFEACVTTPCLYYHRARDIYVVAHVDDFLSAGEPEDLKWVKEELEKTFKLTHSMIGPGQSCKFLGRTIKWDDSGISIEEDGFSISNT